MNRQNADEHRAIGPLDRQKGQGALFDCGSAVHHLQLVRTFLLVILVPFIINARLQYCILMQVLRVC